LTTTSSTTPSTATDITGDHRASRRLSETKAAVKTTELIAYLATVVAIIVTATVAGDGGAENGPDLFDARQAMEYITYLTIAYLIARGLAKSGSREHHTN
jgi:hypothetical protein